MRNDVLTDVLRQRLRGDHVVSRELIIRHYYNLR